MLTVTSEVISAHVFAETYLLPCPASTVELFVKIFNYSNGPKHVYGMYTRIR